MTRPAPIAAEHTAPLTPSQCSVECTLPVRNGGTMADHSGEGTAEHWTAGKGSAVRRRGGSRRQAGRLGRRDKRHGDHEEVESRARAGGVAARRRESDEARGVAGWITRRYFTNDAQISQRPSLFPSFLSFFLVRFFLSFTLKARKLGSWRQVIGVGRVRRMVLARGELDKLEGPTKVSSQPLAGSQASASWHAQDVAADFLLPAASC